MDNPHPKVTIHDVARQAGVSISSVSRALSAHPHVSPALRQRVEVAAEALGYQPDFLAQRLRRGDTASIGFLVGAISNPIMADIFTSSSNYLAQHGYAMILACSQNQPDSDLDYLNFFAQRQVSGLILSTAADGPEVTGALLSQLNIPVVMLDRQRIDNNHVSAVQSDHQIGIRMAVHHLWQQGHRRIALICKFTTAPAMNRRASVCVRFSGLETGDSPLLRSRGLQVPLGAGGPLLQPLPILNYIPPKKGASHFGGLQRRTK